MATRRSTTKVEIPIPSPSNTNKNNINNTTSRRTPQGNTSSMTAIDSPPPGQSPWLPTPLETILLSIYPGTLLVGSLFSTLTVNEHLTPYIATMQSYAPEQAPSYFAKKSNVFNVYFVKIGWFWITLALALFALSHSSLRSSTQRRLQVAARYTAITAAWFLMTQWCFGAPIIDRGFRWTGGQCAYVMSGAAEAEGEMSDAREVFTHAACKTVGGQWKGGHDVSGHVFLLILGSAMLWLELLPAAVGLPGLREARRVRAVDGKVVSAADETRRLDVGGSSKEGMEIPRELGLGVKVALGVAGLSWWMLLMTAAYFHTWFEKTTALIVALTVVYGVYFLPRAVPGLRSVLGMPGV